MESNVRNRSDQDEISLRVLFDVVWPQKRLITSATVIFTLLAGVAAWVVPKKYEASVVVSPVTNSSSGQLSGLSSLTSQLGGLASLAGISVAGDSKKYESIAVLQSDALTERYIEQNDLLPLLYRSKWDAGKKLWNEDNPKKIPTLWKANQYFKKKIRKVTTDTKTGLVTLTISWTDAKTAAKWANDLVNVTNDYLRERAIDESERNIAYLNDEAAKAYLVEAKQAIYTILQTEVNKAMVARGSQEYAFKIIDPATPPEIAASPQRVIWVLAGLFGGFFSSVLFVFIRASWK